MAVGMAMVVLVRDQREGEGESRVTSANKIHCCSHTTF